MQPVRLMPMICLALTVAMLGCASQPVPTEFDTRMTREIVDAETRFAAAVAERGIRDGFLQFFANDGVLVQAQPTPAIDALSQQPPDHTWLDWYPDRIATSAVGDLAVSSGPSEVRADRAGKRSAVGRFLTLWKRDELNTWKVAFDAGVRIGVRDCAPCLPAAHERRLQPWALPSAAMAHENAQHAEQQYETALAQGTAAARSAAAHPMMMLLRNDVGAVEGEAALALLRAAPNWSVTTRSQVRESASEDLAYVYGTMRAPDGRKGNWARVWMRTTEGWRLLVDWEEVLPPQ